MIIAFVGVVPKNFGIPQVMAMFMGNMNENDDDVLYLIGAPFFQTNPSGVEAYLPAKTRVIVLQGCCSARKQRAASCVWLLESMQ